VLCWNKQQGTPPHTHGKGRSSWFKVVQGELVRQRVPREYPASTP
jgi:hypothetical protein